MTTADEVDRLQRDVRDLDARIRACEHSIEDLRASTGREAVELRQSLAAVGKDLEDLTRTLREWRGDLDQIFRERWPTLEGRLSKIETTLEQVGHCIRDRGSVDLQRLDWRALGLIAALLFGGGLTVGGGSGAGISALLSNHSPSPTSE